MLSKMEKAAAYLQELEADRLAAIAVSEEKAEEAKLIKARQEGFRQAMEMLGVEPSPGVTEPKRSRPGRRKRRNIPGLILTELSFSGNAMTTNQIATTIDYLPERTERALKGMERSGQIVRRSRLFGQLPGRNKLKAGSRLLVSPFPEIKFILSCC